MLNMQYTETESPWPLLLACMQSSAQHDVRQYTDQDIVFSIAEVSTYIDRIASMYHLMTSLAKMQLLQMSGTHQLVVMFTEGKAIAVNSYTPMCTAVISVQLSPCTQWIASDQSHLPSTALYKVNVSAVGAAVTCMSQLPFVLSQLRPSFIQRPCYN